MLRKILAAALALGFSIAAQAEFNNPPPFDPHHDFGRVLCWDFTQPDFGTPVTHWGPLWDTGIFECDEFQAVNTNWYPQPTFWPNHTGVIGYENTTGDTLTAVIRFHVNNFDCTNPLKRIWDEAVYYVGGGASGSFFVRVAPGYVLSNEQFLNPTPLPEGGMLDNYYGEIRPNPYWEEFVWTFVVPPGGFAYLDRFCVATECIPEPASALLAAVLLVLRRRV